MKKEKSRFEKMLPFLIVLLPLSLAFKKLSTNEGKLIVLLALAITVVVNIVRLIRYYKEATQAINAIWFGSILFMLTGGILYYLDVRLGMGIAVVGFIAFTYTWQYAFLDNRPDIQ